MKIQRFKKRLIFLSFKFLMEKLRILFSSPIFIISKKNEMYKFQINTHMKKYFLINERGL